VGPSYPSELLSNDDVESTEWHVESTDWHHDI
jgi:hypothetical protein